jgi:hypothetical protein
VAVGRVAGRGEIGDAVEIDVSQRGELLSEVQSPAGPNAEPIRSPLAPEWM